MRRLISGILIGFGTATSLIIYMAWDLLGRVLESKYLIIDEAKVISAAETATHIGTILGMLLIFTGLSIELSAAAIRRPNRIAKDNSNKDR